MWLWNFYAFPLLLSEACDSIKRVKSVINASDYATTRLASRNRHPASIFIWLHNETNNWSLQQNIEIVYITQAGCRKVLQI